MGKPDRKSPLGILETGFPDGVQLSMRGPRLAIGCPACLLLHISQKATARRIGKQQTYIIYKCYAQVNLKKDKQAVKGTSVKFLWVTDRREIGGV